MTHDELLAKVELTLGTFISKYYGSKKDLELRSNVIESLQALRAVVELHKPTDDGLGCSYEFIECHDGTGLGCDIPRTCNQYKPYPCSTIQAIEKELE